MRTVILVPRREGFVDRDATWAWCRRWWQTQLPDLPIIEGHHDTGLFNRSAALNTAAKQAGDWDVAVIIDSDVICHPPNVEKAVETAHETGKLVVAFTVRHNLSRAGSQRIMAGDTGSWRRYIQREYYDQHSSVIAVPRRLWDAVGGFDETFRGWGMEDTAFAIACETFADGRINLEGEVWHLWHATVLAGKRGTASGNSNRARVERYKTAWGNRDAIRALINDQVLEHDEPERDEPGIPRILHRVVPETTNAEVEAWWLEWGRLHPGWQLQTHRDPLDPAEWPETARVWRHVKHGAQLADLVRLEALWRWGGVYVDSDVQPFRSLEPLRGVQGFAAWEDEKVVPNAVMGAVAGHPAIRACLDLCIARVRQPIWQGGPGVTTQVLPGRDDFLLLPPGSFYPVHYRDAEREAKMRQKQPPWAFGLHWYAGSWLKKNAA